MTDQAELGSLDGDFYYQDPMEFFARLRESSPAVPVWMPDFGRVWAITRYADVRAALADPRLVSKMQRWPGGDESDPVTAVHALLNIDPPEHTRLRRLVKKAFTPRRAAQLRPRTAEIAAELLDEMTAQGDVVDLLDRYARPLPITVISELLGIPAADRGWIWVIVTDYGKGGTELQRVPRELAGYFAGLVADKRARPGDDLLSALVDAHDADESSAQTALTSTELLSAAYHLVMAGFDTTVNLIASGMLALLTHPGQMARLRQDPSLLPAAVEELLRFTNPVNHTNLRYAAEDLAVGDVVIPAGERVLIATSSADRDPAQFPDPDCLDIDRDTSAHLAFGHGIHYCLGAPLARMEAEVAIGTLLARFPGLSLAVPPGDLRWRPVSLMNGLEALPIRLA